MFMVVIENMLKVFIIGYLESSLKIIVPQLLGMMDSLGISVTKDEKETERERGGAKAQTESERVTLGQGTRVWRLPPPPMMGFSLDQTVNS